MRRDRTCFAAVMLSFAAVGYLSLHLVSHSWGLSINSKGDKCLPYSVYIIKKGQRPLVGQYIAFRSRGITHFPDGKLWAKELTASWGDRVEAEVLVGADKVQETVFRNSMPIKLGVKGYVHVYYQNGKEPRVFTVYATDSDLRPLPMMEDIVIPQGKYFVTTPAQRSLDSRYWGLVDEKDVVGRAIPVL